jgi:hypothetical protein
VKIRVVQKDNGICDLCGSEIENGYTIQSLDEWERWYADLRMCNGCFNKIKKAFNDID